MGDIHTSQHTLNMDIKRAQLHGESLFGSSVTQENAGRAEDRQHPSGKDTLGEIEYSEEQPYKCIVCKKAFRSKAAQSAHLKTHRAEGNKCHICHKSFTVYITLKRHMSVHTPGKTYNCHICYQGFNHKNAYTCHMRGHEKEKPCKTEQGGHEKQKPCKTEQGGHEKKKPCKTEQVCDHTSHNISVLVASSTQEMTEDHAVECDAGTNHVNDKTAHKSQVINIGKTPGLGASDTSCDNVRPRLHRTGKPRLRRIGKPKLRHFNYAGHQTKYYNCGMCPASFTDESIMWQHVEIKHTKDKLYKCHLCSRIYMQPYTLSRHMETHNEYIHTCPTCGRKFTLKSQLAEHMNCHNPGVCRICYKKKVCVCWDFNVSDTGERVFKCNICKSSFKLKEDLNIHLETHISEKPYKFDVCGQSFAQTHKDVLHTEHISQNVIVIKPKQEFKAGMVDGVNDHEFKSEYLLQADLDIKPEHGLDTCTDIKPQHCLDTDTDIKPQHGLDTYIKPEYDLDTGTDIKPEYDLDTYIKPEHYVDKALKSDCNTVYEVKAEPMSGVDS